MHFMVQKTKFPAKDGSFHVMCGEQEKADRGKGLNAGFFKKTYQSKHLIMNARTKGT